MIHTEGIRRLNTARSRKITKRLITLFLILLGFVLVAPPNIYSSLQKIDANFNQLDGSWTTGLPAALAKGEVSGRDFVFTYGPLYQLLHGVGLLVPPGDAASLLRFNYGVEVLLVVLGVWFVLSLTKAPLAWRAAAYLLWIGWSASFPLGGTSLKPMGGLFLVAAGGYVLAGPAETGPRARGVRAFLTWALVTPVLTLYAFDQGLILFPALILAAALVWLSARSVHSDHASAARRRALRCAAVASLALALFLLAPALAKSWSHYLTDSWELASGYTIKMTSPIEEKFQIALAAAACGLGLLALLTCRRLRTSWRQGLGGGGRGLALVAMACFSLAWLRTGLSRSDVVHVTLALLPAIFLFSIFLPCYLRAEGFRRVWPAVAVLAGCAFLFLAPYASLDLYDMRVAVSLRGNWLPRLSAVRGLELKGARLEITDPTILEASTSARSLQGDALYVWPYETVVDALAGKRMMNYTAQSYAATTNYLEQASVARLEAAPDVPVIVFVSSWPIDEVEQLTRTSHIFRFLLERYELTERHKEFLVLRRRGDDDRQWREQELASTAGSFTPDDGGEHSLMVDLSSNPARECRASDLLVLQLRVARTPMLGVRKPGRLSLSFLLSNGERRTQSLLVPPDGQPHLLLVSAATARDPLFFSIFTPRRLCQSSERVTALELRWAPLDLLSARPSEIALEHVSLLRRAGVEALETPWAQQNQVELWDRCYEGVTGPFPVTATGGASMTSADARR